MGLFRRHVWQDGERKRLGEERTYIKGLGGSPDWDRVYIRYAVRQTCIKCGKERWHQFKVYDRDELRVNEGGE